MLGSGSHNCPGLKLYLFCKKNGVEILIARTIRALASYLDRFINLFMYVKVIVELQRKKNMLAELMSALLKCGRRDQIKYLILGS